MRRKTKILVAEEKKLSEEENKFNLFFNQATDIFFLLDSDLNILDINKTGLEKWHFKKKDLVGKNFFNSISRDQKKNRHNKFIKVIKTGKSLYINKIPVFPEFGDRFIKLKAFKAGDDLGLIVSDITERHRAEKKLIKSQKELHNLYRNLQSIREKENKRIAREIHDELAQVLTSLKIDLLWLSKKLSNNQEASLLFIEKIKSMSGLIDITIKTVQRISQELRPGLLDDLGLVPAIEWYVDDFQSRTEIKCKADLDFDGVELDPERSTTIFRIFQEALTNVARHAEANRVKIILKKNNSRLEMKIRDNGKGITEKDIFSHESLGLIGMRERLHPFSGKLKINGVPNKGTTLSIALPIDGSQVEGYS